MSADAFHVVPPSSELNARICPVIASKGMITRPLVHHRLPAEAVDVVGRRRGRPPRESTIGRGGHQLEVAADHLLGNLDRNQMREVGRHKSLLR